MLQKKKKKHESWAVNESDKLLAVTKLIRKRNSNDRSYACASC